MTAAIGVRRGPYGPGPLDSVQRTVHGRNQEEQAQGRLGLLPDHRPQTKSPNDPPAWLASCPVVEGAFRKEAIPSEAVGQARQRCRN